MDYGNIVYALAFMTLAIVVGLLVFSYFNTKRKEKKTARQSVSHDDAHGRTEAHRR